MSEKHVFATLVDSTLSRWPVIVAALVVGALLGAGLGWSTQPEAGVTASLTVRYVAPTGVPAAPTSDTFVAMALNPSVQATAAAEAGVDAADFAGAVDAAVNSRDRNLVIIEVTNTDEAVAIDMAEALAEAARVEVLRPAEAYAKLYRSRVERGLEIAGAIEARAESLRAQLSSDGLTAAERYSLENTLFNEELRLTSTQEAVESNRFTLGTFTTTADQLGETTTSPATGVEYVLSGSLRGAAIGLFIGIVVAGMVARRAKNDAAVA